ncbi:MAG: hypothetical protein GY856_40850 [bacterium]|nr:hypothetical protein [bacterium]
MAVRAGRGWLARARWYAARVRRAWRPAPILDVDGKPRAASVSFMVRDAGDVTRSLTVVGPDPVGRDLEVMSAATPACPVFSDGFESGDTSAWSRTAGTR